MKYLMLFLVTIAGFAQTNVEENSFFSSQEVYPEYPGGDQKLIEYLYSNFNLPDIDKELITNKMATISFVIDEEGCIGEIKIRRSFGVKSMDNEFIRLVESMPKWKPATSYGKPTRITYNLPFRQT